jgi:CelD/BcsL family acetyltransferase involved in cellulose biosynthesis
VPIIERNRLGALAPAWDELVASSPLPSPFLRSWWLENTAGPGSTFLLVLAGEQLVGGLAVDRDTRFGVDRVRLMSSGDLGPDHLDLLAVAGAEAMVESALMDWFARPGGRFVEFHGVVEGALLEGVVAQMGGRRWTGSSVAPWVELSGNFEEYRSSLPSRLRNGLARAASRLKRLGVRYHVAEPEESETAIEWLRRLHTASWGPQSTFLPAFPRFAAAASVGMARRELVLHQLIVGSEVIATQAWFEVGDRASFYQSGRNTSDAQWRGAGNVLHSFVAQRAFQVGIRELDFLRGNEQYKAEWANRSRLLVEYVAAKGTRGRIFAVAREARTQLEGSLSSRRPSWEALSR